VPTIFTRIIRGEIPGTFIWRDEYCAAFMSINPLAFGHALVVPIAEIDHWVDLPAELAAHLFRVSHLIGLAQRNAFRCEKVGMIIAGYEVAHVHIHLIPTNDMSEFSFANAAASVDRSQLEASAEAIRQNLPAQSAPAPPAPAD
jgi:histidine triad (HIT) family protein